MVFALFMKEMAAQTDAASLSSDTNTKHKTNDYFNISNHKTHTQVQNTNINGCAEIIF